MLERGYTELGQLDHLTLRGAQNGGGQQYQYDALGRMSFRALQGDQAHRYAVDAAGNPLDGQQPVTDNRVTQHNGTRYRYDGAGNMVERQQPNGERLTMGYDGANRLVSLTHTSPYGHTTEAAYRYDGLGRRINKTVRQVDGTTATTHRIVREENESQRSTIVYEPGSFVPMLRIDDTQQGQQLSAFFTDAIGTPMQLVAANGKTQWQAQPDDWAAVKHVRGSVRQPIRFQGQWHDEESGLYYNRHRYYDPQQGRYVSQDPIGLNGGTNLYGYVSNPMGAVDPLGLEPTLLFARELGSSDKPAMKTSGNPLRHEFIVAGEDIYSFQAEQNAGAWEMIWSDGWTDQEGESPNALCTVISEDPEYADAVRHAAENVVGFERTYNVAAYPGTWFHAFGARNCQTWANDVLREADKATSDAPAWMFWR